MSDSQIQADAAGAHVVSFLQGFLQGLGRPVLRW